MKAKIVITPKKAVVDPQGKTVQSALEHMGYQGIASIASDAYASRCWKPRTSLASSC